MKFTMLTSLNEVYSYSTANKKIEFTSYLEYIY